jgi:1,4-dihydroxy-2-naphthoyl-CoA synthase
MLARTNIVLRRSLGMTGMPARALSTAAPAEYEHILVEQKGRVGYITLNRPKALNALCDALLEEVIRAGKAYDRDETVGAIIITGTTALPLCIA